MPLEKPAFPVSVTLGDAESKVSEVLKKKHWKEYTPFSSTLFFVPHWFFSFDVFEEKKGRTNLVSSGHGALNAFTNEVAEGIAFPDSLGMVKTELELPEDLHFKVLDSRISKAEAEKILPVRIASGEGASRENVIISGLRLVLLPTWVVTFTLDGREIGLRINATSGEGSNAGFVPMKEKGFSQLTSEALEELSDPVEWINYSREIVSSFSRKLSGKKASKKIPGEEAEGEPLFFGSDLVVLVLGIVAVIVIIWAFYSG